MAKLEKRQKIQKGLMIVGWFCLLDGGLTYIATRLVEGGESLRVISGITATIGAGILAIASIIIATSRKKKEGDR